MRRGFRWSWLAPWFKRTGKSGVNQQNPQKGGTVESHPSQSARSMGHPFFVVGTKRRATRPSDYSRLFLPKGWVSPLVFDGLGRTSQTQLSSDPSGMTYTLTTYDALGRKPQVYNPTRCSPPTTNCGTETKWGVTTTNYDPLSRVTFVVEQDGSTVSTNCGLSLHDCHRRSREASTVLCRWLGVPDRVWEDPSGLNYENRLQLRCAGQSVAGSGARGRSPMIRFPSY
jgi:hypothetical protein